ncbi:hypothetical protein [Stenotrophomonas sp. SY1]|uniref:hypothetical protein n=1 Tax=Stenotrophomonas sp. SY1 TaxID=477235 RepID=UPI001E2A86E7|nr:hypothetical protein [Stenotrophomonas sp. SY1]
MSREAHALSDDTKPDCSHCVVAILFDGGKDISFAAHAAPTDSDTSRRSGFSREAHAASVIAKRVR